MRMKKNARWKLMQYAFFIWVFISVFALICLRTEVVNLEYELGELGKQKVVLVREGKSVTAEKARFNSMEKIEKVAVERFGMSLPQRDNIFFVKRTRGAAPHTVSIRKTILGDSPPAHRGYR
jgi:cell division protein FtsL